MQRKIETPVQAAEIFSAIFEARQEVLSVCFLTTQHVPIALREIFRGTLRGLSASPREILQVALETNAGALIAAHNHPSGDTRPSEQDFQFTEQLASASSLMGILLLDHLIVGPRYPFFSILTRTRFSLGHPHRGAPHRAPHRAVSRTVVHPLLD